MNSAHRGNHRNRRATGLLAGIATLVLLLTGCAGTSEQSRTTPVVLLPGETGTANPDDINSVEINSMEPEGSIAGQQIENESPWELALRADSAPTDIAIELRLAAIDGFLNLGDFTSAETQTNYLIDVYLSQQQRTRLEFQRGQIALGFGNYQTAVATLQPMKNLPHWQPEQRARLLKALADGQLGLDRRVDAIVSLLQRDALLSPPEQLENQLQLLDLFATTSTIEQSVLAQSAANNGLAANTVNGWLAILQIRNLPEAARPNALSIWQSSYPGHPANPALVGGEAQIALDRYTQIALLMPLTSSFGNAAQAFYDGFIDAHGLDLNVYKPAITLHDIGEDGALASFYYRSAMLEGADFVVGPLGRAATSNLLQQGAPPLPTLVIADVATTNGSPDLFGISLSPELEAQQVAARAFADGHRRAAVLRSDSDWGGRAATAFANAWLTLGGTISTNKSFPDTIEDYSRIIQRFLEVSQSESRKQVLSAQLGINLQFSPRRRDDFDMLFFAGNARQARLLVPQMRFFQAHNLPIYATSNVFTGNNNFAVDADLDGLVFGDMRWMVDIQYENQQDDAATLSGNDDGSVGGTAAASGLAVSGESVDGGSTGAVSSSQSEDLQANQQSALPTMSIPPQPIARSAYSFSPLDRLYALGFESYNLIPRLNALRRDSWQRYHGQAFSANVRPDGNIIRNLDWATFKNGQVILLEPQAGVSTDLQ